MDCKKFGIPLWQCPNFLFLAMGIVIMGAIVGTYAVGIQYVDDPLQIAFLTLVLAGFLLAIAFAITNSFERLAEANRAKSEFVSIVSHQLRSPLSNISWSLEALVSNGSPTPEKSKEYLQIAKENSNRMRELVNDLLTASRIQEGTLPIAKKEFSFAELVKDTVSQFGPWISAANIELRAEGDATLPRVVADLSLVRQALSNFLDNAIRYSKREGERGIIWVRYGLRGKELYCEVQDNGVGIPKEDQKYIFQKFFRSANARRHETQGSGLGLYIAKSTIEKCGGAVGFVSKEDKGSTFWFTIPIK